MAMKMGDYLVSIGVLTVGQVEEVMKMQKQGCSQIWRDCIVEGLHGRKFNKEI